MDKVNRFRAFAFVGMLAVIVSFVAMIFNIAHAISVNLSQLPH